MRSLSGLKAVVTGGASGIGLAAALRLADLGAAVAVLDLNPSQIQSPPHGFVADVGADVSVRQAVGDAVLTMRGLDILVTNLREGYPALERLRVDGLVGAIGIGLVYANQTVETLVSAG